MDTHLMHTSVNTSTHLCASFAGVHPSEDASRRRKEPSLIESDERTYTFSLSYGRYLVAVDMDDLPLVQEANWSVSRGKHTHYVRGRLKSNPSQTVSLHRLILNPPDGMVVDHIDGNGLNNTRANLRVCTVRQNNRNSHVLRGKNRYRGVHYIARTQLWQVKIRVDGGRHLYIGSFKTEEEAALAYDRAAVIHHGEFASLNFPEIRHA